jgi:hypothetical protein
MSGPPCLSNYHVEDNIIAALEHPDRVRNIWLWKIHSPLDRLVTTMQEPFPELESLALRIPDSESLTQALPNTFLGGSAPRLRSLHLRHLARDDGQMHLRFGQVHDVFHRFQITGFLP